MFRSKRAARGKHTEVQIDHDIPRGLAVVDGTTQTQDLTGEHPPDAANGVTTLVVGRNGNIDELGRGVSVAEGDDGDVDVGSLLDGLGVGARVGDDDQTGLLERTGDVVGEGTGGETTSNGLGTGVGGELQDGTLSVGTGRNDTDIGGVVDGGDNAGSQNDLLPVCLSDQQFPCLQLISFVCGLSQSSRCSHSGFAVVMFGNWDLPGLAGVDDVDTISTVEKLVSRKLPVKINIAKSWETYRVFHR